MKCQYCGKELKNRSIKFCDNVCRSLKMWELKKTEIEKSGFFPTIGRSNETNRRIARRYLEEKFGHKCSICGIENWNGKELVLVVDHIDGNPNNSSISNIRLICPNCDSQLFTYKNRRGKKRAVAESSRAMKKKSEYDRKLNRLGLKRVSRVRAIGICSICGNEFKKKHSKQKLCSKRCVFEANRRNPSGFCKH